MTDSRDELIEAAVAEGQPIERQYLGVWGWHRISQADAVAALGNGMHRWLRVVPTLVVAGVDVTADRMSVVIHGDGTGVALPPVAPGLRTAPGRVAPTQQATPHVGTPAPARHAGNSTPVLAPVAGAQKSEQVGERGASK